MKKGNTELRDKYITKFRYYLADTLLGPGIAAVLDRFVVRSPSEWLVAFIYLLGFGLSAFKLWTSVKMRKMEFLEPQVDEILKKMSISEEFKNWAVKYCNELNDEEVNDRNIVLAEIQKNYDDCIKRLDNLVRLKISPQNTDGSLLSDDEFKGQKESIVTEKRELESRLGSTGKRIENWIENLERGLDFAVQARYRFATGTLAEKRDILATIGSNMILEDKKLRLDAQKPYCYLTEILKVEPSASVEFEPKKRANNTAHLEALWAQNPAMQG